MKCAKDIMSSPVVSVAPDVTVQDCAKIMAKKNIGSVAVLSRGKLIGILTERDISKKVVASNKDAGKVKAKDIMHTQVVTSAPTDSVYIISSKMAKGRFRRMPIIKNGRLIGIVTETDVEIALQETSINELKTKIHELEVFNKMAIGRELKMTELKKKIEELEGKMS